MRLAVRAFLLAATLAASAVWPAVPGFGAGAERAPHGGPPSGSNAAPAAEPRTPPLPKDPVAQCLHDQMNLTRAAQGVLPLAEIRELLEVAQKHSDKMAAEQWMHHSTDAVFEFLPPGWLAYGENVVYGRTCEQMFDATMDSDPHRDAMLRADFNYSGTAVSRSSDGWIYATVIFVNLPYLPPSLLPPAEAPPVPAPAVPAPAAQPPLETPAPAPAPALEEPVPSITFGPFPTPAAPGADSARGAEVPAEGPRRLRRPSAKDAPRASKTRGKAGGAASPAPGAHEAYVWVLEDEPQPSVEEEFDPSQMDFDLEAELPAPGPEPGV